MMVKVKMVKMNPPLRPSGGLSLELELITDTDEVAVGF